MTEIGELEKYLSMMHTNILEYKKIKIINYDEIVDFIIPQYNTYLQKLRDAGAHTLARQYEEYKRRW